jgi:hypothetical protein
MNDLRAAAQQALNYWESASFGDAVMVDKMDALRAALAQQGEPVQEPFGYLWPTGMHPEFRFTQQKRDGVDGMPLYTAPPQRLPLTEEEIDKIFKHLCNTVGASYKTMARAVERAHGIKE